MKFIVSIWNALLNQGVYEDNTRQLNRDIVGVNQALVILVLLIFTSTIYLNLFLTNWYINSVALSFNALLLLSIALNKFRKYKFAKFSVYLNTMLFIFWSSSTFGYDSNLHFVYTSIIISIVIAYWKYQLGYLIAIIVLGISLPTILFITEFSVFKIETITPEIQKRLSDLSFFLCVVIALSTSFIYLFNQKWMKKSLIRQKNELKEKNILLNKTNEELDKFVYSASHDLKSPISSVLGLINLSKKEKDPKMIPVYMGMAEESLHKMQGFIKDLIDHSRNSRLDVEVSEIQVEKVIDESLQDLGYSKDGQKIKRIIEVKQNINFASDERRLKIIFNNLISNSIKYSKKNIEDAFLKIDAKVDDSALKFSIEDNGQGIDKEHLEHIFQMFYRANTKESGSGLGLFIVNETVEKLEGKISVESEIHVGTKISVAIPNLWKNMINSDTEIESHSGNISTI